MIRKSLAALSLAAIAPLASAQAVTMCVFDVIGANGDVFNMIKDYSLEMKAHGVDFQLKPYTDEGVAVGDFNAGQCDVVAATDLRTRPFNRFTGTVSAMGALPTYDDLKTLLGTLVQPKAAPLMKENGYEVLGILPLGAGYLFVDDKNINSAARMAGKRIAVLDYQKDAVHMANYVKSTVVPSDITNFAGKFNNGSVNISYAPPFAYEALELYKGIGDKGGVVYYPLAQLTGQIIAREGVLDAATAQKAREVAWAMFPQALNLIESQEKAIPDDKWIRISDEDIEGYQEMFRRNRIQMRDGTEGAPTVYSAKMLGLLSKIRCASQPTASECTSPDRE